jgi:hypothetical protein
VLRCELDWLKEKLLSGIDEITADLLPEGLLIHATDRLCEVWFDYRSGTADSEDFRKALVSWLEGLIKALHPVSTRSLTRKQERFIGAYLECGNGAEACRRAGYAPKWAHKIAFQLMQNSLIRQEIDNHRQNSKA